VERLPLVCSSIPTSSGEVWQGLLWTCFQSTLLFYAGKVDVDCHNQTCIAMSDSHSTETFKQDTRENIAGRIDWLTWLEHAKHCRTDRTSSWSTNHNNFQSSVSSTNFHFHFRGVPRKGLSCIESRDMQTYKDLCCSIFTHSKATVHLRYSRQNHPWKRSPTKHS